MKTYIGTKIIQAEPQRRESHDRRDPHFGISEGYKVVYPDGYVSWSPKAAFEEAYRETTGIPFGLAIEAMKKGHRIARQGWSSEWCYLVPASSYPAQTAAAKAHFGDVVPYRAYVAIKKADNTVAIYTPTQTDMLADDWAILDG